MRTAHAGGIVPGHQVSSPHTRGWSPLEVHTDLTDYVVPAHAGLVHWFGN